MKVTSPLHYNGMACYKFDMTQYKQTNAQLLLFVDTRKKYPKHSVLSWHYS